MKKLLKSTKRWFTYHGRNLATGMTIVVTLSVGAWYAITQQEEVVVEDFGDAALSVVANEISDLSYADAVELMKNGETAKGLTVMQRLAPLSSAIKGEFGNGDAHMWVAKDIFKTVEFGYLGDFPLELEKSSALLAERVTLDAKILEKGVKHIEAAISLKTQEVEPVVMLAEVFLAQGERNEAVNQLVMSACKNDGELLTLGFWLANTVNYKGDDLALQEILWHKLTTQGEAVAADSIGDLQVRLEYVLHALLLKKFELASTAVAKFERDFGDVEELQQLVSELKAVEHYFHAVASIQNKNLSRSVEKLLKALEFCPDDVCLVNALKQVAEKHPELSSMLKAGLNQAVVESPDVDYLLLQSLVSPGEKLTFLEQAVQQFPLNVEAVLAYVDLALNADQPDLAKLEKLLAVVLAQDLPRAELAFELCYMHGVILAEQTDWNRALLSFERALVCKPKGAQRSQLHMRLSEVYKQLGMDVISAEHLALVN